MKDPCFDQLREILGLDSISGDQRIWRFLTLDKAKDFLKTFELYLCQVSILRNEDPRESRLPTVLHDLVENGPWEPALKDFLSEVHQVCESQADGVYASCWFIPGSAEQEKRMWDKCGGGLSGGVRIDSTVERLISSWLEEDFGLGMIRYIREAADPFDSPEQGITGEVFNRIDGIHHPQIVAQSMSLKGAFGTRHVGAKLAPATKFPAQACAAICT